MLIIRYLGLCWCYHQQIAQGPICTILYTHMILVGDNTNKGAEL